MVRTRVIHTFVVYKMYLPTTVLARNRRQPKHSRVERQSMIIKLCGFQLWTREACRGFPTSRFTVFINAKIDKRNTEFIQNTTNVGRLVPNRQIDIRPVSKKSFQQKVCDLLCCDYKFDTILAKLKRQTITESSLGNTSQIICNQRGQSTRNGKLVYLTWELVSTSPTESNNSHPFVVSDAELIILPQSCQVSSLESNSSVFEKKM